MRVVVIGAGFGGLGVARELHRRGIDVVVLERAESIGGVWRDNTYPGAACDVPSPLYSWSWAPNLHWSHRYAGQAEILAYLRSAAEREGLTDLVRTSAEVASCVLEEQSGRWTVTTTDSRTYDADLVVSAVGQLSNPVVPDLPGRDTFAGPAFHSAQWPGDVDLTGRRVAVVGTGASAIQFVPAIAERAASVTVFQRSAPYVVPRPDQEYRPRHHRAFERWPALALGERRTVFWLSERLNHALGSDPTGARARSAPAFLGLMRLVWRAHLRRAVPDRALRRRLTPKDPIGCKRILFSNDWYPTLARPDVEVVSASVAEVEPDAVRTTDGRRYGADVLIWGTGFAATDFLAPMRIAGRDGLDLREVWRDGARAHLGITVPGFPNLFLVYGPNTNLGGSSIIGMMEAQAGYIADVAEAIEAGDARLVEVRERAARAYDEEMQRRLRESTWARCESWYRDGRRITTNWPGPVAEYQQRTAEVDWSELAVTR